MVVINGKIIDSPEDLLKQATRASPTIVACDRTSENWITKPFQYIGSGIRAVAVSNWKVLKRNCCNCLVGAATIPAHLIHSPYDTLMKAACFVSSLAALMFVVAQPSIGGALGVHAGINTLRWSRDEGLNTLWGFAKILLKGIGIALAVGASTGTVIGLIFIVIYSLQNIGAQAEWHYVARHRSGDDGTDEDIGYRALFSDSYLRAAAQALHRAVSRAPSYRDAGKADQSIIPSILGREFQQVGVPQITGNGNILYTYAHPDNPNVISKQIAYVVNPTGKLINIKTHSQATALISPIAIMPAAGGKDFVQSSTLAEGHPQHHKSAPANPLRHIVKSHPVIVEANTSNTRASHIQHCLIIIDESLNPVYCG